MRLPGIVLNQPASIEHMSKPVRVAIWLYVCIAVATLIAQIPIRLHYCSSGTTSCAVSFAKAPVWAALWPVYWPAFFRGFL